MRRSPNISDLQFLIGYCAAVTSVRYVDNADGIEKTMTVDHFVQMLDGYGVAAPAHSVEGHVTGERVTAGLSGLSPI